MLNELTPPHEDASGSGATALILVLTLDECEISVSRPGHFNLEKGAAVPIG
jgi:hypothetical protein